MVVDGNGLPMSAPATRRRKTQTELNRRGAKYAERTEGKTETEKMRDNDHTCFSFLSFSPSRILSFFLCDLCVSAVR